MSDKKLKKEQEDAINLKKDLLLSANAGSGKTYVMLQRVVHFIVDENASILDFLLITFTDAASTQMRTKLQKELIKKYNDTTISKQQKEHLKKQIALLPQADISTIHTFCFNLIKKYFYVINLNASCSILDEQESNSLKEKAISMVLDKYSKEQQSDFMFLLSTYSNKRNFDTIKDIIYKLHNYLTNQPDVEQFYSKVRTIYERSFEQTEICSIIDNYVVNMFKYYKQAFEDIKRKTMGFDKLMQVCDEIILKISQINETNGFAKNHNIVFNCISNLPDKPRKNDDLEFNDWAQQIGDLKKDLKDDIKRVQESVYLSSNIAELQQDLSWCKDNVNMIIGMEKEFAQYYTALKKQYNGLDFSDLEHYAYDILQDDKICNEVSKHYKQIFVDEYQDVNDIQESIISMLWKDDINTLFLVGDIKQSIYRFRNTNPQIMLNKIVKFDKSDKHQNINLVYNFRSDENILNFSNYVFSKLMTLATSKIDYENKNKFQAGLDYPKQEIPVVELDIINSDKDKESKIVPDDVYSVKDAEFNDNEDGIYAKSEAYIIASKISDMMKNKYMIYDMDYESEDHMREINFGDIAILYRSGGAYIKNIVNELIKLGIPIKTSSSDNVFEEYEVQVLFNYLKLLINEKDEYALVGFLSSPIINCSFSEMALLREDKEQSFYEICVNNKQNNEKLQQAFDLIQLGREKMLNNTIYEVLNWLIVKTDYENLVKSMKNGEDRWCNIQIYVKDFLNHSYNNNNLVEYLFYIEKNDTKNSVQSNGDSNAISVVTMHHSKGLEYPIVFAVDMAHEFNKREFTEPCIFNGNLGIGLQTFDKDNRVKMNTIVRSAITLIEKEQDFAEQLRVLYVGLTRAKNNLFILGRAKISKIKNNLSDYCLNKYNSYMALLLACLSNEQVTALQQGQKQLTIKTGEKTKCVLNVYDSILLNNDSIITKNEDKICENTQYSDIIMQNIVENNNIISKISSNKNIAYKNSVSRIMEKEDNKENYSIQPKKFTKNENNVTPDKIGTAYHKAMEIIPFDIKSVEDVREYLSQNMLPDEFNLINCGKILKCVNYLHKWTDGADKIIREGKFYLNTAHENLIKNGVKDNILIQGVVDLIVCKGGETLLLDFKTNKENDDDKMREKYKIQLECYKIAVENALNRKVTSKILYSFFKDCEILFDK